MATNETQVSSLPMPPSQYVNLYTDENIRRNRAPRPPNPPGPHDLYSMFGVQYNNDEMIRSLESQNIKRLIPVHFDRRKELKKLNHSLFVNFLDLIDLLIQNPDSPRRTEKIDDLSLLFVNLHHLLNEFRPHQARETLRVMMEMQKRQRIETATRFQKHLDRVRDLVNSAFADMPTLEEDAAAEQPAEVEENPVTAQAAKNDDAFLEDCLMCKLVDEIE